MVNSVDDLKTELAEAVQELSVLTQEHSSKNLSASPLDARSVSSTAPEDLTVLMEQIQKATKPIDELKKRLYGDSPINCLVT